MIPPFQSCCPWQRRCGFTQRFRSFCLILETTKPDTDQQNNQKKEYFSPCKSYLDKINESKWRLQTNQAEVMWLASCAAPKVPSWCDFSSFLWANFSWPTLPIPSKFTFLIGIIVESQLWGLITCVHSASLKASRAFSLYFNAVTLWLHLNFRIAARSRFVWIALPRFWSIFCNTSRIVILGYSFRFLCLGTLSLEFLWLTFCVYWWCFWYFSPGF